MALFWNEGNVVSDLRTRRTRTSKANPRTESVTKTEIDDRGGSEDEIGEEEAGIDGLGDRPTDDEVWVDNGFDGLGDSNEGSGAVEGVFTAVPVV